MDDKIYCVKCDRSVPKDKVCDTECEQKAKEVREFLKAYDKIFGDESPLGVLQEIAADKDGVEQ